MASLQESQTLVLRGEKAIMNYLEQHCMEKEAEEISTTDLYQQETSNFSLPGSEPDGCSVEENCEEPQGSYPLPDQSSYHSLPGN